MREVTGISNKEELESTLQAIEQEKERHRSVVLPLLTNTASVNYRACNIISALNDQNATEKAFNKHEPRILNKPFIFDASSVTIFYSIDEYYSGEYCAVERKVSFPERWLFAPGSELETELEEFRRKRMETFEARKNERIRAQKEAQLQALKKELGYE